MIKNKWLEKHLEEIGHNTEEVWTSIMKNDGSVQHLGHILSKEVMEVFKTAREINPMWYIEHASIRQPFVCQGQSLNLFPPVDITKQEMSDIHFYAWKKKVKTLYYLRGKKKKNINIGTGGDTPLNSVPVRQKIEYDSGGCLSCEA